MKTIICVVMLLGLIGCSDEPKKDDEIKILTPKPPRVVEHVEPKATKEEAAKEKEKFQYAEDGIIGTARKSGATPENLMDF